MTRRNLIVHLSILAVLLLGPLGAIAPAQALSTPSSPAEPFAGKATITVTTTADEMLVLLTAEDLAQAGPGKLTILTAGAGESSAAQFTVLLPGENPAPTASSYVFDTDSSTVKLVVSGSDFVAGAQVLVNGSPRPTTVIAADVVVADLTTADFNAGGAVRVANPGPGGGTSNPLQFAVRRQFVPQLRK